jgi:serine phosphatase RsbU (regulator of sigma subunit)
LETSSVLTAPAEAIAIECTRRRPDSPNRSGGDFMSSRYHSDGSITLLLVDLAAKAEEAEYQTFRATRAFRRAVDAGCNPGQILRILNQTLLAMGRTCSECLAFGSAIAVRCSTENRIEYSAAGTEGALLFTSPSSHRHLPSTGPLIGIQPEATFATLTLELCVGSMLIAYTDGVTESRGADDPGRFLGTAGLVKIVAHLASQQTAPSCDAIMRKIEDWNGGRFLDDASLASIVPVTAHRLPKGGW